MRMSAITISRLIFRPFFPAPQYDPLSRRITTQSMDESEVSYANYSIGPFGQDYIGGWPVSGNSVCAALFRGYHDSDVGPASRILGTNDVAVLVALIKMYV